MMVILSPKFKPSSPAFLTAGWGGEGKKAGELGLNFGDKITIIGYHTSYKDAPQVGGAFLFSKGE